MNYRHAFHAGNFADCFKHALLVDLVDALVHKPKPFFVLDTHAGAGHYDLGSAAALRTGESEAGIQRLLQSRPSMLRRYLEMVDGLGLYPGSPSLIAALLRPGDRLACSELQAEDAALLRRLFKYNSSVEVHERSGWEALSGLLPPKEKRGLVFIDPPFERRDEFTYLVQGLKRGHSRFSNGIFAIWYPIKQMAAVRSFHAELRSSAIRDIVSVELYLRETVDPDRLNGCGLAVINPPYKFASRAEDIAGAVLAGLSDGEAGAGSAVLRLADE